MGTAGAACCLLLPAPAVRKVDLLPYSLLTSRPHSSPSPNAKDPGQGPRAPPKRPRSASRTACAVSSPFPHSSPSPNEKESGPDGAFLPAPVLPATPTSTATRGRLWPRPLDGPLIVAVPDLERKESAPPIGGASIAVAGGAAAQGGAWSSKDLRSSGVRPSSRAWPSETNGSSGSCACLTSTRAITWASRGAKRVRSRPVQMR